MPKLGSMKNNSCSKNSLFEEKKRNILLLGKRKQRIGMCMYILDVKDSNPHPPPLFLNKTMSFLSFPYLDCFSHNMKLISFLFSAFPTKLTSLTVTLALEICQLIYMGIPFGLCKDPRQLLLETN